MRFWKPCVCSFVSRSKPNELFLYFIYFLSALLILISFTRFVLSVFFQLFTNINISNGTFIKSILIDSFVSGELQAGAVLSRNSHDDFKGLVTEVCVTARSEGKPPTKNAVFFDLLIDIYGMSQKSEYNTTKKQNTA